MKPEMSVSLAGVELANPVAVASGTFGFGREYAMRFDLNRLGAICAKGLTLKPRIGNPPPRVAETPSGLLNSVGLQNPGVEAFLREELPFMRQYSPKIIANMAGNTVEEYAEMASLLAGQVDLLEVNISCPNVKAGGLAFGTDPTMAALVTETVKKKAGATPVLVKLSPLVTDIAAVARAVEAAGADGLSLINTLPGMRIDVHTRRPILAMNTGGLSGPAVLPVAVRCVWQVAQAVRLPLLGMGGVSSGFDAAELMLAGATAVAVGSALFRDPLAALRVLDELENYCQDHGVALVAELTGAVRAHGV